MIIWFEFIEFVTEATHQQLLMLLPNIIRLELVSQCRENYCWSVFSYFRNL